MMKLNKSSKYYSKKTKRFKNIEGKSNNMINNLIMKFNKKFKK